MATQLVLVLTLLGAVDPNGEPASPDAAAVMGYSVETLRNQRPRTPPAQPENQRSESDLDNVWITVKSWHAALTDSVPSSAAWLVLAAPVWVPLFMLLVVKARKQREAIVVPRARVRAPAAQRDVGLATGATAGWKPIAAAQDHADLCLSPAQLALMRSCNGEPSLYETFVALGARQEELVSLRRVGMGCLNGSAWSQQVRGQGVGGLRDLRQRWILETAADRVGAWLTEQPPVVERALEVSMPAHIEGADDIEGLTLSRSNGLGVKLDPSLAPLVQLARAAMRTILQQSGSPYSLAVAAERTGLDALNVLIPPHQISPQALVGLLHGTRALRHAAEAGLISNDFGREFAAAVAEHGRLVSSPIVGEGCGVFALQVTGGVPIKGIGTLLASSVGAAHNSAQVVVRISKVAAALSHQQQDRAVTYLGHLMGRMLDERVEHADRAVFQANIRRLLGGPVLEAEKRRAVELVRWMDKGATKRVPWLDATDFGSPDVGLTGLHVTFVSRELEGARAAERRMHEIFQSLAHPGQNHEHERIAQRRLGYATAGLGMELFRDVGDELLGAARAAVATLTRAKQ